MKTGTLSHAKSHALLESGHGLAILLTSYFEGPKFKDIFSRLEMSDARTGEGCFPESGRSYVQRTSAFVRGLSELAQYEMVP